MTSFSWPPTSGGVPVYSTFSAFPATASGGSLAVAADTNTLYNFNTGTATWYAIGKPGDALSIGTYDSNGSSANGATINVNALIFQSASVTVPGMVNTGVQSFAGNKTFTGTISASNLSGSNTGDVTLAAFGSTPSANGASLSGQVLTLQPADATHPGGLSIIAQTIAGDKTFSGNISAANLSGTNTGDGNVATTQVSANASYFPLMVASSTNGTQVVDLGAGLTFNPSTNNLSTTTFTGDLVGNATSATTATTATTATNATNVATTQVSNNASYFPLMVSSSTNGNQPCDLGTGLTFNPSTNNLSTTTFTGALIGNASTATTSTTTTNVDTVQVFTNANFPMLFVASSVDSSQIPHLAAGVVVNPNTNTITANFSGSLTGTASNATVAQTVATTATNSTNASFFLTFVASSSSSNQGIDTATGLSFNPSTNNLTTTTFTGALVGNASTSTSSTTATNATNIATTTAATNVSFFPVFVATAGSANQASRVDANMTYNPGIGKLTLSEVAALFTGNLTGNVTGNADTATLASTSTVTSTSTNASFFPVFVSSSATGSRGLDVDAGLSYNPSTDTLTTTTVAAALTGTASGNTAYTANNHGVVISGAGNTMTVIAPDSSTTKVLTSGGLSADPTWQTAGVGTVTSVTFTGDGTVLSSTPSSAVTTSGTLTATIKNQNAGTFLAGPTSGSAAAPTFRALQAPTIQKFTSGSGTYTTATGALYIVVEVQAGGGGGGGGGTGSNDAGNGSAGATSSFGTSLISCSSGAGGAGGQNSNGGAGGTVTLTGVSGFIANGGTGGGGSYTTSNTGRLTGGMGGVSFLGGSAGNSYGGGAGVAAATNSGSGGSAGGGDSGVGAQAFSGAGGGAGAFTRVILTSPSATYAYVVGAGGSGGAAGSSNGHAGAAGADGMVLVTEHYQ